MDPKRDHELKEVLAMDDKSLKTLRDSVKKARD